MRCEKTIEFALPPDEVQCSGEAEIRVDCAPTKRNEAGKPGTLFLCRDCADNIHDSDVWEYEQTSMESGEPYEKRVPTYKDVKVYSKEMFKALLEVYIQSDQFKSAADEALEYIASWGVDCVKLEVTNGGIFGHTRTGDRAFGMFKG